MRTSLTLSLATWLMLGSVVQVFAQNGQSDGQARRAPARPNTAPNRPSAPSLTSARAEAYKTVGGVKLKMYLFLPPDHQPSQPRPAIVFFFGGGWSSGSPKQFERHCEYLASRGMVACAADYRVSSRHGVKAVDCVRDAKSAIRWLRKNADRLNIDPDRIAAGGGSAGGHLAACTGVIDEFDESSEDHQVSSRPNALVLFNPALVLAPVEGEPNSERIQKLSGRMGVDPRELSPYHHVAANAPPAIVFHGEADSTVPFRTAEHFAKAMKAAGNRCELKGYPDAAHGFFNWGRGGNGAFRETMLEADRFLESLGYLHGDPTLDEFIRRAE